MYTNCLHGEKMHEFTANIIIIGTDPKTARYQITVPKKDVDAGLIDPTKTHRIQLIPIEKPEEK